MKLVKILLVMTLVLATVFAVVSCDGGTKETVCEHTYEEAITKAATCTEEGEKTLTCSLCGDVQTEVLPKTDHKYAESKQEPTCTEDGKKIFTCSCGDSYEEAEEEAFGHDYFKTEVYATCSQDGSVTYTCRNCGETYSEAGESATGIHTYVVGVAALTDEEKAANPGAIGVMVESCSGCGARKEGATAGSAVLLNLDFETEETSLLAYVNTQNGISSFLRGDKYSDFGSIQNGVWYNAGNNQVMVNEDMGLKDLDTYTISVDFVLGVADKATTSDRIFGWGGCGEDSKSGVTTYFFDLCVGEDGLLHALRNSKATTEIALFSGFTFDDREAWYHLELTVDVKNQSFTASAGKWTDDTLTTLAESVELTVEDKGSPFHAAISAARPQPMFRFSNKNGLAAMDNFVISVPLK